MDEAYRLAKAVCMAGMAPKGLETPEKAMVAILHGLEIGLTPMAALQRIAVVNGRPTIWGDGAIGLVRGSGACDWIRETIAGESDAMTATCQAKRKGEPEPIVGTFSVADAKKAGLWGKGGPWQQFPKRMLQMRARAFALRDGFADVLGGLYLREEIEEAPPRSAPPAPPAPQTAPPAPQTAPPPTPVAETPRRALTPPNPNKAASEPPPPAQSASINFDAFRSSIRAAATQDDANAIYDREVTNRTPSLHPDELDEADAILRDECAKFWSEEA
jgi:hypothetical protein